jgi:hypothetical protein
LVQNYAFYEFSVLNRSSDFLDDTNIPQIDVCRGRGDEAGNSGDGDWSKDGRILRYDLNPGD